MQYNWVGLPLGSVHTNVKALLKLRYSDYMGSYRMDAPYKRVMGKEIDGTHYRGGDDAKDIATMLGTLLNTKQGRLIA